jgi:hypothetical protein
MIASLMIKATGIEFSRRAPNNSGDWHVGPRRQFGITLSGRGEIEVAGGQKVQTGPGGHITRNLGSEDRFALTVPLADQTTSGDPTRK